MQNPRCIEWFEKVANGLTRSLPLARTIHEASAPGWSEHGLSVAG